MPQPSTTDHGWGWSISPREIWWFRGWSTIGFTTYHWDRQDGGFFPKSRWKPQLSSKRWMTQKNAIEPSSMWLGEYPSWSFDIAMGNPLFSPGGSSMSLDNSPESYTVKSPKGIAMWLYWLGLTSQYMEIIGIWLRYNEAYKSIYTYIYIANTTYISICKYIYIYTNIYIYMYICVYIYIYMCIYSKMV